MIERIAWAVPPQSRTLNRPTRLVTALRNLGVISPNIVYYHHGTSPSSPESSRLDLPIPRLSDSDERTAILSPVVQVDLDTHVDWIDYYDDWSIAPDVNLVNKRLAARSYKLTRRRKECVFTVNSRYMAMKLNAPLSSVVPNGVDPALAEITRGSDDRRRVIILGNLMAGRTDTRLLAAFADLEWLDEIVFAGIGSDKQIQKFIADLKARYPNRVTIYDWLDNESIARIAGSRTVGLVPHVVNDYTISQDLMKAYTFHALGIRTICPYMLWPEAIETDYAFLLGPGVDLGTNLKEWIDGDQPSSDWRLDFARRHSWTARAATIAERIIR